MAGAPLALMPLHSCIAILATRSLSYQIMIAQPHVALLMLLPICSLDSISIRYLRDTVIFVHRLLRHAGDDHRVDDAPAPTAQTYPHPAGLLPINYRCRRSRVCGDGQRLAGRSARTAR